MKQNRQSTSQPTKWLQQRATLSALYNLVDVPRLASEVLNLERIQLAGDWLRASCPFVDNHKHGDKSRSFGMRMDGTGRYNCFVCGSGDFASILMKVWGKGFDEVTDWLREYVNAKPEDLIKSILEKRPITKKDFIFDGDRLSAVQGRASMYVLKKRHISLKTYCMFKLGYHKRTVYFPIYDFDGKLIGLVTRPTEKKQYMFEEGTSKTDWLYGIQHVPKGSHVFMVEGHFDCLRLWTLGYPAVATMGTSFSEKQGELLINRCSSVTYIRDNDPAGKTARQRAYDVIANRIPFYITGLYRHRKDIGECNDKEIHNLIQTKHLYLTKGG